MLSRLQGLLPSRRVKPEPAYSSSTSEGWAAAGGVAKQWSHQQQGAVDTRSATLDDESAFTHGEQANRGAATERNASRSQGEVAMVLLHASMPICIFSTSAYETVTA